MVTAINVAKYIYSKGITDKIKVLKLLYISFGFYGARHDKYLFEESIEAWKYGPVVTDVYKNWILIKLSMESFINEMSEEETVIVDEVVRIYGKSAPFLLVDMTHKIGTPWHVTRNSINKDEINKDLIIKYYKSLLTERDKVVKQMDNDVFKNIMLYLSKT